MRPVMSGRDQRKRVVIAPMPSMVLTRMWSGVRKRLGVRALPDAGGGAGEDEVAG